MKRSKYFIVLVAISTLFIVSACSKQDDIIDLKEQFITAFVNDIEADSLQSTVEWLENMDTRFMLADNRKEVALSLKERFVNMGYTNAVIDSFYVSREYSELVYNTWQYNVIATIRGTQYPDSIIVIGAHYDNILSQGAGDPFVSVPGANDNASGVAGTMEIARLVKTKSYHSKYSMQFVLFAAEELGLYGSVDFAAKARANNNHIKLMINHDMIAVPSSSLSSEWSVNILNYQNSRSVGLESMNICNTYSAISSFNDNTHANYSDSYAFFRYGYKSLFFTQTELDVNYHTVDDLSSHMNFDYCKEIVKASCAVALHYSYSE